MPELREMFFAEAEELAATIAHSLQRGDRPELIRAVHTLKGVAGVLGLDPVVAVCHQLEEVLDAAPLSAVREATTALVSMVDSARASAVDTRGLDRVLQSLAALRSSARPAVAVDHALRQRLTDAQWSRLEARLALGDTLSEEVLCAPLESLAARESEAIAGLSDDAEVIARDLAPAPDGQVNLTLLVASPAEIAPHAPRELSVRVPIARLDAWMHGLLELGRVARALEGHRSDAALRGLSRDLERHLGLLRAGILEARMVPLKGTLEVVAREVKRMAEARGRRVRVELDGADLKVDRALAEALIGPLTHLARNAVDHGIEGPEARRARSKPEAGVLGFRVRRRGAQVEVEVEDDGAGVDTDALVEAAVRRGLQSASQVAGMSHAERVELMFASGLSSRVEASVTSGRGVGMDAVRSALHVMGAVVEVESAPGAYTRVRIAAPLTLAVVMALDVTIRGARWVIPMSSVTEVVALPPEEGARFAVVLGQGSLRTTVQVDRLLGQREVIVRPLGVGLSEVRAVAGVAELDAGELALVLNVAEVLTPPRRGDPTERLNESEVFEINDVLESEARGRWLSVEVGTREVWIDLGEVREVLRVPPITEVPGAGAEVSGVALWRSRVLTVLDLARRVGCAAEAPGEGARLVVLASEGRLVGLRVSRIRGVARANGACGGEGAAPEPLALPATRSVLAWARRAPRS